MEIKLNYIGDKQCISIYINVFPFVSIYIKVFQHISICFCIS